MPFGNCSTGQEVRANTEHHQASPAEELYVGANVRSGRPACTDRNAQRGRGEQHAT
jgi:hypothetical protein